MANNSYDTRGKDRPRPISSYSKEELESLTWADPHNPDEVEADLAGWWMDPAGGLHSPDDDDPAAMYE